MKFQPINSNGQQFFSLSDYNYLRKTLLRAGQPLQTEFRKDKKRIYSVYMDSMRSANWSLMAFRLTFMVGVTSPSSV